MHRLSPTIATGLITGLLFYLHALIPNSHAWPMLWPLVAGVITVILAARRHRLKGFWNSIRKCTKSGSMAGFIFLVFTLATLLLLSLPQLESAARALGSNDSIIVTGSLVLSLTAVAALGILLAAVAGALVFPIAQNLQEKQ